MSFNELNSAGYFIIKQLIGVNLTSFDTVAKPYVFCGLRWQYLPAAFMREQTEILVENELKQV
jgi:hypothetical protein